MFTSTTYYKIIGNCVNMQNGATITEKPISFNISATTQRIISTIVSTHTFSWSKIQINTSESLKNTCIMNEVESSVHIQRS